MNPSGKIHEELADFILLGQVMDVEYRQEVAELLFRHFYDPAFDAKDALDRGKLKSVYPQWYQVIRKVIADEYITRLTHHHADLALGITRDICTWCWQTELHLEGEPAADPEKQALDQMRQTEAVYSRERWEELLDQLSDWYPAQNTAWDFYRQRLKTREPERPQDKGREEAMREEQQDILRQKILAEWESLYRGKRNAKEQQYLDSAFDGFSQQLREKALQLQEFEELLSPYNRFLGEAWQASLETWNKIDWEKIKLYAERIKSDPRLKELTDMLGRWEIAEQLQTEAARHEKAPQQPWSPPSYGKSEIVGVHHSDQLSALLPSEVALLSYPETELIFSKKFVEKKLLTFRYRSPEEDAVVAEPEAIQQKFVVEKRGPIIICIDTSGSMFGLPERVAKALALEILNLALKEKRRLYLISFSQGITTAELTGKEDRLDRFMDFLQMSFSGGTDIQPAFREAIRMLKTRRFAKADVLVISDFLLTEVDPHIREQVDLMREERGTRFHSLFITRNPIRGTAPPRMFDFEWVYDLERPGIVRKTLEHLESLKTTPHRQPSEAAGAEAESK